MQIPCLPLAFYMALSTVYYSDCGIHCIPYLREKGPMGSAPYIGSRLGDGPIFEVSLSQLDVKERPGKLPT